MFAITGIFSGDNLKSMANGQYVLGYQFFPTRIETMKNQSIINTLAKTSKKSLMLNEILVTLY